MCILIGKYFPKIGWVGVKNRDRNYIPEISFRKIKHDGSEILYFWDDITQYCEGFNSHGVGVLSSSLMVLDDEKEIEKRADHASPDGRKIKRALRESTARAAIKTLIDLKLPGNTMVWNRDHMYLLEGAWRPGEYRKEGYSYQVKEIPQNKTVVRTNHGIWLTWAGYQRGKTESQTLSRISSESRFKIAQYVSQTAESPTELLDNLSRNWTQNSQLNALRTATDRKRMRTTSQVMIVPSQRTMFVRPVQSHIHYNFWRMNHPSQKTWVELISNRVLYQHLRPESLDIERPFRIGLNHDLE